MMDKNKIIILALIVIIAALLICVAAMMIPNMSKQDTKLIFKSNSTLTEGDSIKIKLTDANGTAITNQTVNVKIIDMNGTSDNHSVVTNGKGVGTLKIDKNAGNYSVTFTYGGNDKYNGCNVTKKITIEEEVVVEETTSSQQVSSEKSSSSSSANDDGYWETSPDAPFEYHTEYDSNGGFRQYDHAGNLVGSSYDEDQDDIADYVPRRI